MTGTLPLFERTIEKSSQLAVRWIVVLVFALALLASKLGLDLLLGGFAAGLITRQVLQKTEVPGFDSKLNACRLRCLHPVLLRGERHAP
ncbi:MAG TPA: cation:proton antiporter [Thermoleophilaceae bacterium]